jgi:hypothetical protein
MRVLRQYFGYTYNHVILFDRRRQMKSIYRQQHLIQQLIEACNNKYNIDKRIEILYHINSILAKQHQLRIPSLITNAYINTAIYKIEEIFC